MYMAKIVKLCDKEGIDPYGAECTIFSENNPAPIASRTNYDKPRK